MVHAQWVEIGIDYDERRDPPLVKKIAQFNSGIAPIEHYRRDAQTLTAVDTQSLRVDLGVGAGSHAGSEAQSSDRHRFFVADLVTDSGDKLTFDFRVLDEFAGLLNEKQVLPYLSWCYIPWPLQRDDDSRKLDCRNGIWRETWRTIHHEYAAHFRKANIKIGYH